VALSPASYNGNTSLMVYCPLTTKLKGYLFGFLFPVSLPARCWRISQKPGLASSTVSAQGSRDTSRTRTDPRKLKALIGENAIDWPAFPLPMHYQHRNNRL
jgi:hypothetical protein